MDLSTIVGSKPEALVTVARLELTDGDLLHKLMRWAPGGRPLTDKSLGDLVGLSNSKIHALRHGHRPTVETETAARIAAVLGVHRGALFFEPLSTPVGVDSPHKEGHPHA